MIKIKYEVYYNDNNFRFEDKSFNNLSEFKDWMFGLMHRPYVDDNGDNMLFLDGYFSSWYGLDHTSIVVRPDWGGAEYKIYCVSDNNNIVYSNGRFTNGQCYISEGFKAFMKECQDKRDGKVNDFVFGEIEGYTPPVVKSYAEQAADFIKDNPGVAWEISRLIDLENKRADVVGKLKERGLTSLSDEEIDDITSSFKHILSNNEGYYESYWMSVDYAIDEFVKEKAHVVEDLLVDATQRSTETGAQKPVRDDYVKE